jgi:hypothetical protein
LEPFADGFAAELRAVGYQQVPVVFQLQLMAHLSRWLDGEDVDARSLTAEVVERFWRSDGLRAMPTTSRRERWRRCWGISAVSGSRRRR